MADKTSRKSGGNQPISRHPLFPAIVALWFGALFGLAGIAIRPALIEQAVVATGIDSLVPMAAPPLGATARIVIALAMTAMGGVVGALVARRIVRPETEKRTRRRGAVAEPAARTLPDANVADEEALAQPSWKVRAMRERARETAILDIADFEIGSFDEVGEEPASTLPPPAVEPTPAEARDPAPGSLFDAYAHNITARADGAENAPENSDVPDEGEEISQTPLTPPALANDDEEFAFQHGSVDEEGNVTAEAMPAAEGAGAAECIVSAELESLSQVELLERLALAMARCRSEALYPAAVRVAEQPAALAPDEPEPEAEHGFAAGHEPEPRDAARQAFEPPAVQLPRLSAVPDFDVPVPPETAWTEPEADEGDEIAEAGQGLTFGQPARMPAALRPVGDDCSDDAGDDALPGYIPPRHIGLAPHAAGTSGEPAYDLGEGDYEEDEDEESDVLEEGYSSLLNMSRSAAPRPSLAHADEFDGGTGSSLSGEQADAAGQAESAAGSRRPFDAPGSQDADETEKALRAALATLQRMSGAA